MLRSTPVHIFCQIEIKLFNSFWDNTLTYLRTYLFTYLFTYLLTFYLMQWRGHGG